MEVRYGLPGTELNGVFFTEKSVSGATQLKHIKVEISRQNSDLSEVKARLAEQVHRAGGNALINFRYGQRKHGWWELFLLKWDTESWHGEGDAVRL
jgi:hypothetical protein